MPFRANFYFCSNVFLPFHGRETWRVRDSYQKNSSTPYAVRGTRYAVRRNGPDTSDIKAIELKLSHKVRRLAGYNILEASSTKNFVVKVIGLKSWRANFGLKLKNVLLQCLT